MKSTLLEFLLFNFDGWLTYGNMILKICGLSLYPVFVFSLIFDQASSRPNPVAILKRLILAQIVIFAIPNYYIKTVSFGFNVGDSILSTQKKGLIGSWNKIKRKIEKEIKKNKVQNKNKKEIGTLEMVAALFSFDGTDMVEKAAAVLIFICILLIKVIYSLVYYATYCLAGIMAVLSVFPFFSNHLMGALKSVLYLILTAIIIALVLTFMNASLDFQVSSDGFLVGLFGLSKFLVLCFVLLGSLKISQSLVNGIGAEGWAGNMGSMLGAGLAYKSMGMAQSIVGSTGAKGAKLAFSTIGGPVAAIGSGVGFMASRPLAMVGKSIKKSLGGIAKSAMDKNAPKDYFGKPLSSSFDNSIHSNLGNHSDTISQNLGGHSFKTDLLKGRYESSFNQVANIDGGSGIKQALNPSNHLKASYHSSKGLYKDLKSISKSKIGLPEYSKKLTTKEKTAFIANKLISGKSAINVPANNMNNQIKQQVIADRIGKIIRKKNA